MIQSIQCCGFGSGIGKKVKSGSGMNIPYHISECLETIFWVNLKYKNGEYKNSLIQIWILDPWIFSTRDGKNSDPGSGKNVPDPQHLSPFIPFVWIFTWFFSVPAGQRKRPELPVDLLLLLPLLLPEDLRGLLRHERLSELLRRGGRTQKGRRSTGRVVYSEYEFFMSRLSWIRNRS